MRKTLLLAAFGLALPSLASAQELYKEDFNYPENTQMGGTGTVPTAANPTTGWATHSGVVNQILTEAAGLTFTSTPAYPHRWNGRIALTSTESEDISHQFAQQTSGSVYASLIVQPDAVPNGTNGSYFFHLAANTVAGATFRGRVYMARGTVDAAKVRFGVAVAAGTPVFGATEYTVGTPVLVVLRYDIVAGTLNDAARIYVFEQGADISTEPVTATATATAPTGTDADPANIGAVALRQGTSGTPSQNAGSQTVDGLRVGTSWASAPLPVELSAFTATTDGTTARLVWTTAAETNNSGFAIEQLQGETWTDRGFRAGRGTTAERSRYTYDVENLSAGTHTFRLRQIDLDGTTSFSPTVTVEIGAPGGLVLTPLAGRAVRVQAETEADVTVYDVLGRQVIAQRVASGTTEIRFDGLSAGVYVVRALAAGKAVTQSVVVR